MLAAVNLRRDLVAEDPGLPTRVGLACREAGMLDRPLVAGAIAVSPPLVIGDEEIGEIAAAFRTGLDAAA
jgi:adenosylmethionine-8-amino-7-oxononanoate aminotransferase